MLIMVGGCDQYPQVWVPWEFVWLHRGKVVQGLGPMESPKASTGKGKLVH